MEFAPVDLVILRTVAVHEPIDPNSLVTLVQNQGNFKGSLIRARMMGLMDSVEGRQLYVDDLLRFRSRYKSAWLFDSLSSQLNDQT